MKMSAILGGLAGAAALTLLHEVARKNDKDAPQMHKVGMDAVAKTLDAADAPVPSKKKLFYTALVGELITNTLLFAKVGSSGSRHALRRGVMLGLGAGLSAVFLPKQAGLKNSPTDRTDKTKGMTIAWYLVGGLVAGATAMLLDNKKKHALA